MMLLVKCDESLGELVGNSNCARCLVLAALLELLGEKLIGEGLCARCLVLAMLSDQRLIAFGHFPVTVKILFYLLAMGKNTQEERPQRVRGTLRGVQPLGLTQGASSHGRGQMSRRQSTVPHLGRTRKGLLAHYEFQC